MPVLHVCMYVTVCLKDFMCLQVINGSICKIPGKYATAGCSYCSSRGLLNWLVLMISLLLKTPLCGEGKTRNLTSDNAQTTPRHQQTTDIQKAKEAKRIIIGR